jgi:hypothetical protein
LAQGDAWRKIIYFGRRSLRRVILETSGLKHELSKFLSVEIDLDHSSLRPHVDRSDTSEKRNSKRKSQRGRKKLLKPEDLEFIVAVELQWECVDISRDPKEWQGEVVDQNSLKL